MQEDAGEAIDASASIDKTDDLMQAS